MACGQTPGSRSGKVGPLRRQRGTQRLSIPRRILGPRHHADKAKCAHFARSEWVRLQESLQEAIAAGCVNEEFRGGFPIRAWAYINGILHEARLSNRSNGEYHGFPLEYPEQIPSDPANLLRNAPRVEITIN